MTLGTTSLYFSLCLLYLSLLVEAYIPVDLYSVNCGGSFGNLSSGDRTWIGDMNSKFLIPSNKPSVTAQPLAQSSTNTVPYTTTRLSYSEFSYSFPVTPGQKFVRLFFYPTSYQGFGLFDRSKALFSVKSGRFTLLKDFNASLNADVDKNYLGTILKEYIINVDDGERLSLTFTPSTASPDSYAFINGIEVVSMPTDLYYSKPDDKRLALVGHDAALYTIKNDTALETKYRLNVGGRQIPPEADTGMLRSWEGDDNYVREEGALPVDYSDRKLSFTQISDYTAPVEVYKTARSMGSNATINLSTNLTWVFTVDSGFNYMLRLHFCELDPHVQSVNDRRFIIYIAEQLADYADILLWSKKVGTPTFKDYVVIVPENQKKSNLLLQLHPHPNRMQTLYFDAILSGLEIFKLSQGDNLAGPDPDPLPPTPTPPKSQPHIQNSNKSSRSKIVICVTTVLVSIVILLSVVVFLVSRIVKVSKWAPFQCSTSTVVSSLPTHLCRYFSVAEIRAATKDFDDILIIGAGGFGNVYLGYIDNGTTPVAIKRLKSRSQQGALEFMTEIEMLSQLRHLHLVSLIGYCNDGNEMILVYDFMARGTLREHLYNTDNQPLSWKQRLHICIGAARGLQYLHTSAKHNIIHRDVKTTNILLDENWVAKVSDFGLSKIGPTGISKSHITTMVKGSFGYLDPEYYMRQRLTQKSDVYAFGVVLLEVLCGRPPLIREMGPPQANLVDWAKKCHSEGVIDELVDPFLKGIIAPKCFKKYSEMAMNCLLDDGTQRPSMNEIVWGLEFALQLQESTEDATSCETQNVWICEESVLLTTKFIED